MGTGQGAWGSRGRNVPLAVADGMRKVLHLCGQTGNSSCSSSCPSAGFAYSGTRRGSAKHWMLLYLPQLPACIQAPKKELERDWLEHVVQSGWMKKRMWDTLDVVGSFPVPLTEP